jgi:hypothetical protein
VDDVLSPEELDGDGDDLAALRKMASHLNETRGDVQ